jgi:hypothetical protein
VPLFPDPGQDGKRDGTESQRIVPISADGTANWITADLLFIS